VNGNHWFNLMLKNRLLDVDATCKYSAFDKDVIYKITQFSCTSAITHVHTHIVKLACKCKAYGM